MADTAQLYLDLLKRVLTGTLERPGPDYDDWRFPTQLLDHCIRGEVYSMLPVVRLDNVERCMKDVLAKGVPGDFIETGVWRGGATIFMRALLKAHDVADRRVWVADSFQGLPQPDPEKFPKEARVHASKAMTTDFKHLAVSRADVEANFARFGLFDEQVRFLEGWFKDTLPTAPIVRLSVMRLDGDYYESTMDALTGLYDRLSPGGYVIIDDYGEDAWADCSKAVDEFRRQRGITAELVPVDSKCRYWQRPV
jgi:hypothetical protein